MEVTGDLCKIKKITPLPRSMNLTTTMRRFNLGVPKHSISTEQPFEVWSSDQHKFSEGERILIRVANDFNQQNKYISE